MTDNTSIEDVKRCYIEAQARFGNILPHLILACAGGSDEHWQIWNSEELHQAAQEDEEVFPVYIIENGQLEPHPDGSRANTQGE